jgi:hypothetical protein
MAPKKASLSAMARLGRKMGQAGLPDMETLLRRITLVRNAGLRHWTPLPAQPIGLRCRFLPEAGGASSASS